MTCGIYKLNFNGTDKVYIGQSVNIEKRYKQHVLTLRNGTANYKLAEAYELYGVPLLEVLIECSISELDTYEDECIEIWESATTGLNVYATATEAPTYTGFGSGNSKYSKDQILDVFQYLVNTPKSFLEISELTLVGISTVCGISLGQQHLWLREENPEMYKV